MKTLLALIVLLHTSLCDAQEQVSAQLSSQLAESERLTLHSHPWVGLHHFLFQWARSEVPPSPRDTRTPARVPEKVVLSRMDVAEREEWEAALAYYNEQLLHRSLVFEMELSDIKAALCALDPAQTHTPAALGELGFVLEGAMPIYRAHFWPAHDAANRLWIREQAAHLARFEKPLAAGLVLAWGSRWPEEKIRVDVSPHTNWAGAYTTHNPNHVMISSRDEDMSGWHGLETLFHEVSHSIPLQGDHNDAVDSAFADIGAQAPNRLWHAFLFYTAGELTREALQAAGIEDFQSYAEVGGFYERESWSGYRDALDRYWLPVLHGEVDRESAYASIAAALAP